MACCTATQVDGFNDAPANCRGRHHVTTSFRQQSKPGWSRFNDAPANCRGRRARPASGSPTSCGFNDAPANCRGRHRYWLHSFHARSKASTMPRRIAGGDANAVPVSGVAGVVRCFNDAPANCRGRQQVVAEVPAPSDGRLQRCPGELPGETPGREVWPKALRDGVASTMPRRIAGGDAKSTIRGRPGRESCASTMPRRIAGGDSMAPTHCLPMRDSTNCERCRNIAWPAARATGSGLQIVKEHDALQ